MPNLDNFQRAEFNSHYRESYAQASIDGRTRLVWVNGATRQGAVFDEDEEEDEEPGLLSQDAPTHAAVRWWDWAEDGRRQGFEHTLRLEEILPPTVPAGFSTFNNRPVMFSRRPLTQIRRGITHQNSAFWGVRIDEGEVSLSPDRFDVERIISHHDETLGYKPIIKRDPYEMRQKFWDGEITAGWGFALSPLYALICDHQSNEHDLNLLITSWGGPVASLQFDPFRLRIPRMLAHVADNLATLVNNHFTHEVTINVR